MLGMQHQDNPTSGYLMVVSAEVVRRVGSCLSWRRVVATCLSWRRVVATCLSWKRVVATSKSCCGLHRYPTMRSLDSLEMRSWQIWAIATWTTAGCASAGACNEGPALASRYGNEHVQQAAMPASPKTAAHLEVKVAEGVTVPVQ